MQRGERGHVAREARGEAAVDGLGHVGEQAGRRERDCQRRVFRHGLKRVYQRCSLLTYLDRDEQPAVLVEGDVLPVHLLDVVKVDNLQPLLAARAQTILD